MRTKPNAAAEWLRKLAKGERIVIRWPSSGKPVVSKPKGKTGN